MGTGTFMDGSIPRKPSPTMTTACINPSKGRFLHPIKNHGISLRDAARLQTFPDTFVFEGGLMAGGVQVGNAVPIRLAEILLRHLANLLLARKAELRRGKFPRIVVASSKSRDAKKEKRFLRTREKIMPFEHRSFTE